MVSIVQLRTKISTPITKTLKMSILMIVDSSKSMKTSMLKIPSEYNEIPLQKLSTEMKFIVNCVYDKFFKLEQKKQIDFICLMLNDRFPQYPIRVIKKQADKILQTIVSEHNNLLSCKSLSKW
jgi:hypothetical protein